MVDAVIRHWMTGLAAMEVRSDGFGRVMKRMSSFFYAKNVLLDTTRT